MTEWIIPGNAKKYNLINAFQDLGKIDWKQSTNINMGDIVYIYVSGEQQRIMFKCKVNKVNLKNIEIEDSKYNLSGEYDGSYGRYMELEMTDMFDTELFSRVNMEKHGFSAPQGSIRVTPQVKEYLNLVQSLLNADEMDPDKHDGCYEFMREIIKSYSTMDDLATIDYKDLNLVYFSCIGSWTYGFDKKKRDIAESHLPTVEKSRLINVLEEIMVKAKNREYYNRENDEPTIGMFGSGFKSFFGKATETSSQNFIKLCVDILQETDENIIFEQTEKVIKSGYKGMGVASVSVTLHTLKPYVFPIINGNASNGNLFVYLNAGLKKSGDICKYIDNCRIIRKFRDANFKVKNYRIYDRAIWNVGKQENSSDFWPSYDEYPVDITKDEWKKFIEEVEFQQKGCMRVLKCYMDIGGIASPKKMAELYKGHSMVYTGGVSNTSRRALKYFEMEPCIDANNNSQWLFPIAFQGKNGEGEDKGTYVYRMRDELMQALKELDLSDIDTEYSKGVDDMNSVEYGKNIILYGPPGTGKTYHSAIYAVAICDGKSIDELNDYDAVMKRYNELKFQNRIAFTTFHQSYGYEEFIEGIKPVIDSENDEIGYTIESGIFKKFCENAKVVQEDDVTYTGTVWAYRNREGDKDVPSDFEKSLYEEGVIKIEDINDTKRQCGYIDDMISGDWVVLGRNYTINAIGVVVEDVTEENTTGKFRYQKKVEWKAIGLKEDCRAINRNKGFSNFAIAKSWMKIQDLQKIINGNTQNVMPFVFIIDEINRGNISKIFGELITLIEDTKREGCPEATNAILPYSNELFSVPSNVYILGTMNTADRSIALMDTALRRRFDFIEMMPDAKVLREIGADVVDDLDVVEMLERINERITFLYDREHTIGHAFFTGLKEEPTIDKLANIFSKSVIPLLQEYFYEDYQKIQLVLGDNAKSDEKYKFIKDSKVVAKEIFKGSVDEITDLPEKKYEINEIALNEIESYKEII